VKLIKRNRQGIDETERIVEQSTETVSETYKKVLNRKKDTR